MKSKALKLIPAIPVLLLLFTTPGAVLSITFSNESHREENLHGESLLEAYHRKKWMEIIEESVPTSEVDSIVIIKSFLNCKNTTVLIRNEKKFIKNFHTIRRIRNLSWFAEGAAVAYHSRVKQISKAYRALRRLEKTKYSDLSVRIWEDHLLKAIDSTLSSYTKNFKQARSAVKILKKLKTGWSSHMKAYDRAYLTYLIWKARRGFFKKELPEISEKELNRVVFKYPAAWFSKELVENQAVHDPLAKSMVFLSNNEIEKAKESLESAPEGALKDYLRARILQKEKKYRQAFLLFYRAYPGLPRSYKEKAILFMFSHTRNKFPLLSKMLRMRGKPYRTAYRYLIKQIQKNNLKRAEEFLIKGGINYIKKEDRVQLSLLLYARGRKNLLYSTSDEGSRFWKALIKGSPEKSSPQLMSYYYFALKVHIENKRIEDLLRETSEAFAEGNLKEVKLPPCIELLAASGDYILARKLMRRTNLNSSNHIYSLGKKFQKYMWYKEAIRTGYLLLKRKGYSKETISLIYPLGFVNEINEIIEKHRLRRVLPSMALSLVWGESCFDRWAVSPAGALGLTQLMPFLAEKYMKNISRDDILKVENNLYIGLKHLDDLLKKYNFFEATAAYNAGEGRVKRWKKRYTNLCRKLPYPELAFVEFIPFEETRGYVKKLYRTWQIYRIILHR